MQPDRHHARRCFTLGIEHVKAVFKILVKLFATVEALGAGEAHIVHVQCVWNDQVGFAIIRIPVRQVITVIIRVIQKTACFDDQAPGIGAGAARVPAQRAFAHRVFDGCDRSLDVLALNGFIHILVIDPTVAMATYLVTRLVQGLHRLGVALYRHADREHRDRYVVLVKQLLQTPHAHAAAVLVDRLHAYMAHTFTGVGPNNLRQECFGGRITVQHTVFATFLVIEHHLQSQPGAAGPPGVRRVRAIAGKISGVKLSHDGIIYTKKMTNSLIYSYFMSADCCRIGKWEI